MSIIYKENTLTANDFVFLQNSVGWGGRPLYQIEKALENTIFSIAVYDDKNIIGMGRLIGDCAFIWYLMNIVICPNYQHKGIGTEIVKQLLEYINKNSLPETTVTVGLSASKGKEAFYEKLGFRVRPNEQDGAGMVMYKKVTL